MSSPKPQYIANLIFKEAKGDSFVDLRSIIHDVISDHGLISSEELIWDYIDDSLEDIVNELYEKISSSKEKGIQSTIDLEKEGDTYYVKCNKPSYAPLLDALYTINPNQFECFCATIINYLGGKGRVNGGPSDGGIDFIGEDLLLPGINTRSLMSQRCTIIGQSKHYVDGHNVCLNECREFIGAAVKYRDDMPKSQIRKFQPFIYAYWTTSDFHKDASLYLNSLGVWTLNGLQLSALAKDLKITQDMIMSLPEKI